MPSPQCMVVCTAQNMLSCDTRHDRSPSNRVAAHHPSSRSETLICDLATNTRVSALDGMMVRLAAATINMVGRTILDPAHPEFGTQQSCTFAAWATSEVTFDSRRLPCSPRAAWRTRSGRKPGRHTTGWGRHHIGGAAGSPI